MKRPLFKIGGIPGVVLPPFNAPVLLFIFWIVASATLEYRRIWFNDHLRLWGTVFVVVLTAGMLNKLLRIRKLYVEVAGTTLEKEVLNQKFIRELFFDYRLAVVIYAACAFGVSYVHFT